MDNSSNLTKIYEFMDKSGLDEFRKKLRHSLNTHNSTAIYYLYIEGHRNFYNYIRVYIFRSISCHAPSYMIDINNIYIHVYIYTYINNIIIQYIYML